MTRAFARLRLITGEHDDLLSLRTWLTDEDALRGLVALERNPPQDGEMGTVAEVLVVALGASGAVTALARSMPAWLRRHADVTIEVGGPTGHTVRVSAKGAVNAQAVIQTTLDAAGHIGDSSASSPIWGTDR